MIAPQHAKARILVTLKCVRSCDYCCNRFAINIARRQEVQLSDIDFQGYKEIIISGGEPLLRVNAVYSVLDRVDRSWQKTYLYTSIWHDELPDLMAHYLSGIHWMMHVYNQTDYMAFQKFQDAVLAHGHQNLSVRLAVSPGIKVPLGIIPWCYKEIRVKKWKGPDEFSVQDEDHYLLKETA